MAKRKPPKTAVQQADESGVYDYPFIGGPRKGQRIRLVWPARRYVRLGLPEFCTYEYDAQERAYIYLGPEPPPVDDTPPPEKAAPYEHPVDPAVEALAERYKATEAWERGRALAAREEGVG